MKFIPHRNTTTQVRDNERAAKRREIRNLALKYRRKLIRSEEVPDGLEDKVLLWLLEHPDDAI